MCRAGHASGNGEARGACSDIGVPGYCGGLTAYAAAPAVAQTARFAGHWLTRRSAMKRELLSLIGHCQHAASVVKPGRTFLHHLIDLAASVRSLHHRVHVRGHTRSDLYWWSLFLEWWNGNSMIPPPTPTYTFASDASESWGAVPSGEMTGCSCSGLAPGHGSTLLSRN